MRFLFSPNFSQLEQLARLASPIVGSRATPRPRPERRTQKNRTRSPSSPFSAFPRRLLAASASRIAS